MNTPIPMLIIGLIFGAGIGFAVAATNNITLDGHDHADPAAHGEHMMTDAHDNHHGMPHVLPQGTDAPTLELEVLDDPASGWNLHLLTTGFDFAPQNASHDHVTGEGHAHLYVNGVKIGRVYGNWAHLAALPDGDNLIEVELNGNDHRPLQVGETVLRVGTVITVP